jgi:hypothetical protein
MYSRQRRQAVCAMADEGYSDERLPDEKQSDRGKRNILFLSVDTHPPLHGSQAPRVQWYEHAYDGELFDGKVAQVPDSTSMGCTSLLVVFRGTV